ncbi:MAG: hypothetical protein DWQ04_18555 [Chloroflexi bacterium]|nr:MAG: hypothetical protein DWQ04_18555 [Chloroflexota bacterium]
MLLDNYFEDLLNLLKEFRDLLDEEIVQQISNALTNIANIVPDAANLFAELKAILTIVRNEINGFDIDTLLPDGLESDKFISLIKKIESLIEKSKPLLPSKEAGTANDIQNVAGTIAGLPEMSTELKTEIVAVIDVILKKLP